MSLSSEEFLRIVAVVDISFCILLHCLAFLKSSVQPIFNRLFIKCTPGLSHMMRRWISRWKLNACSSLHLTSDQHRRLTNLALRRNLLAVLVDHPLHYYMRWKISPISGSDNCMPLRCATQRLNGISLPLRC
jgi:hypothetical protein